MDEKTKKAERLTQDAINDFKVYYWAQYTSEKLEKWPSVLNALRDSLKLIFLQDINLEAAADVVDRSEESFEEPTDNEDDADYYDNR